MSAATELVPRASAAEDLVLRRRSLHIDLSAWFGQCGPWRASQHHVHSSILGCCDSSRA
jgi:hypothetical protein